MNSKGPNGKLEPDDKNELRTIEHMNKEL